jgi:hypothetical protein
MYYVEEANKPAPEILSTDSNLLMTGVYKPTSTLFCWVSITASKKFKESYLVNYRQWGYPLEAGPPFWLFSSLEVVLPDQQFNLLMAPL